MWIKIKGVTNQDYYRNEEIIINTDNIAYMKSSYNMGTHEYSYDIWCSYNGDNYKSFRIHERYYRAIENFLLKGEYKAPEDVETKEAIFQLVDLLKENLKEVNK